MKKTALIISSILLVLSCKTPLQKYVKSHDYTPFTIMRTDWGVGTVVSYNNGVETIEAFPNECVDLSPKPTDVTLRQYEYTLEKTDKIELDLGKALGENVDLSSAFNNKRISKVKISIENPKEKALSRRSVKNKLIELAENGKQGCVDDITTNTVIIRVLEIGKLNYSFLDEKNKELTIDAQIMNDIKFNSELKRTYEGKTEITIETPTLVGYRLSQFDVSQGLTESDLQIEILSSKEVKKLISKSNQTP